MISRPIIPSPSYSWLFSSTISRIGPAWAQNATNDDNLRRLTKNDLNGLWFSIRIDHEQCRFTRKCYEWQWVDASDDNWRNHFSFGIKFHLFTPNFSKYSGGKPHNLPTKYYHYCRKSNFRLGHDRVIHPVYFWGHWNQQQELLSSAPPVEERFSELLEFFFLRVWGLVVATKVDCLLLL